MRIWDSLPSTNCVLKAVLQETMRISCSHMAGVTCLRQSKIHQMTLHTSVLRIIEFIQDCRKWQLDYRILPLACVACLELHVQQDLDMTEEANNTVTRAHCRFHLWNAVQCSAHCARCVQHADHVSVLAARVILYNGADVCHTAVSAIIPSSLKPSCRDPAGSTDLESLYSALCCSHIVYIHFCMPSPC